MQDTQRSLVIITALRLIHDIFSWDAKTVPSFHQVLYWGYAHISGTLNPYFAGY